MHNPRGCWRECAAAALALFCANGLNFNAFAVYIPYLTEQLELSYAQSSNFILVRTLFSFGSMFFVKLYYDKLELRMGMTLALVLTALSTILYAGAGSFTVLCIAAAISGLAYGLGGMYPAAILIHRWFPCHEGLALGICAASTGLAITVGAPILTLLTETYSMGVSMFWEIGFMLVCTAACFFLIRNYPHGALHHKIERHAKRHPIRLNLMFFAMLSIGVLGGCYTYLTLHYTVESLDPYQISTLLSVIGLILTAAKFILGEALDLWGTARANWLVLPAAVLSCILFSIGSSAGFLPALIAACLFGVGDSVVTVGLTAYARDFSTPEEYASTNQQYQIASGLGGLVCAPLTGMIVSATGNYRGFFLLATVLTVFATVVIQTKYARLGRKKT